MRGLAGAAFQPSWDAVRGQGLAPEESLGVADAEAAKFDELVHGFDALSYYVEMEGVRHSEYEFDDGRPMWAPAQFFDKGAVDFQGSG